MTKRNLVFTVFLLMILSLIVCGTSFAETSTISGHVYDAFTGKGVEGAIIYYDSTQYRYTLSGEDGFYILAVDYSDITSDTTVGVFKENYNGCYVNLDSQEPLINDIDFSIEPAPNGYELSSYNNLMVKADAPSHCTYLVGASGENTIRVQSTRSVAYDYPDVLSLPLQDAQTGDIVGYLAREDDRTFSFTGELSAGQTVMFDLPTLDRPYEARHWYVEVRSSFEISVENHITHYLFHPDNMENTQIRWLDLINNSSSPISDYEWSIHAVDVPVDAIRLDVYGHSCDMSWDISSPPAGDYVYQISCAVDGQTVIKQTTIHLLELPNGAPEGISFPDQIIVPFGESVTETASLLPDGWSIPGVNQSWYVDWPFAHGEWLDPSENDYLLVSADNQGQYTFTGITSGRYVVSMSVTVSNLGYSKTVPVIVLNEDGSEPDPGFSISLPEEVTVYKLHDWHLRYELITEAEIVSDQSGLDSPVWSLQMVDAPADLVYIREGSFPAELKWDYAMAFPVGDYIYDVSCTWNAATVTKRIIIHLQDSPVGAPTGISFPDRLTIPLGETVTETASILPAGWSLPGWSFHWYGHWFLDRYYNFSGDDDSLAISCDQDGLFTFTGNTPGVYLVKIGASANGLTFEKRGIYVTVLNADGTRPEVQFELNLEDERAFCRLSDDLTTFTVIEAGVNYGGASADLQWSLTPVNVPKDSIHIAYTYDTSIGLCIGLRWSEAYPPAGDYTYEVSCTADERTLSKRFTVHLLESPDGIPEISFPDSITLKFGETITERAHILPDGWRIPDGFDFRWGSNPDVFWGSNAANGNNDLLRLTAENGLYTMTGLEAGYYSIPVGFYVDSVWVGKEIPVLVLNEDGSDPVADYDIDVPEDLTVYRSSDLQIAHFEVDSASSYYWEWELLPVNVPEDAISNGTNYYRVSAPYMDLFWKSTTAPAGDYIYDISCRKSTILVTKRITIHLLESPTDAPEGISFPDQLTIPLGETVTETASILPAGWSLPGWSFNWFGYCDKPSGNDNLVISCDQDGQFTFTGNTPGVYMVDLTASANGIYLFKRDIYVTVLNADGTKPELQFELHLGEEETTMYRLSDDLRTYYSLPSPYATYDGPSRDFQWSLTPISVPEDSIQIAYSYSTSSIGLRWSEACPPSGDYTYEVSCTIDERTLSKRFTIHLLDCPDGIPEISFPDSITLKVGETITESVHILPEGWRIPEGADFSWTIPNAAFGSAAAGGENSFLRITEDNGAYTLTGLEAGYYSTWVGFRVDSVSIGIEIPVLVLNEDGSEPVADYDIDVPEELTVYRSSDLQIAHIEVVSDVEYNGPWEWTVKPVSVPEDAINSGESYEVLRSYQDIFWTSDTAPAGDYIYDISCRKSTILVTKRITIHLLDEEIEAPSLDSISASLDYVDSMEIALGLSGGDITMVTIDLYKGLDNALWEGIAGPSYSSPVHAGRISDGLYQIVATVSNSAGSSTLATGFYRVSSGSMTALDGILKLPASLTRIEEEAFAGIEAGTVICPSDLKEIGANAFQGSTVTRIEIPASVTFIADTAFSGCTKYVTVVTTSGSAAESWAREHGYLVELH